MMFGMGITADRLGEAMRRRGWDQTILAERVGATQGAISKILVGKTSNSRLMPAIATEIGVSLAWLLGKSDDETGQVGDLTINGEERDWLDLLRTLTPEDREAVIRLTRSLANCVTPPSVHVPRLGFTGKDPDEDWLAEH